MGSQDPMLSFTRPPVILLSVLGSDSPFLVCSSFPTSGDSPDPSGCKETLTLTLFTPRRTYKPIIAHLGTAVRRC